MDEDAAARIVESDAFAVVTLTVKYDLLADPERAGLTQSQLTKLQAVETAVGRSIEIMEETGSRSVRAPISSVPCRTGAAGSYPTRPSS